jgi:hypothetical protein
MTGPEAPGWRRLILVTGHRRSGSTWLAAALGKAQEASLIPYEPIWLKWHRESPYVEEVLRWRGRQGWYFAWDPDSARDQEEARVLRRHLGWLSRRYFDGLPDSLVVKEPHPNWLDFLAAAFQPDRLISLRRHPLGIVNSFDKGNLYSRWKMEQEWASFLAGLADLFPDLVPIAGAAHHPAEQVAFLAQAGDRLQDRLIEAQDGLVVQYEALCLEARDQFAAIYRWLGWAWDEDAWDRLRPLVAPESDEREAGFIKVRKRSEERAYAWRRELPWHLIRRVGAFVRRLQPDCPLPGDGLPSLSSAELAAGYRTYLSRRRAFLRNFGLRSLRQSL